MAGMWHVQPRAPPKRTDNPMPALREKRNATPVTSRSTRCLVYMQQIAGGVTGQQHQVPQDPNCRTVPQATYLRPQKFRCHSKRAC